MFDDATNGDETAGDKLFTSNQVRHGYVIIRDGDKEKDIGPRNVRIQSEVRDGNGRLHATAVEFQPFSVVKVAPTPTVVEVHPRQVRRGNVLTDAVIEGGNFNGTPTLAFLLNGQPDPAITVADLTVVHSGKLRFTLNVSSAAPPGERVVQVTTAAGASSADKTAANTFTVNEIDINGDNSFDISDAIKVLRIIVGLD
jgi:hypothetical protein